MTRKEAFHRVPRWRSARILLSVGISAVTIVAIALAVRNIGPVETASAQVPRSSLRTTKGAAANAVRTSATPASGIKTLAVVNGEPITRQQLGQECVRRYGTEVLESMVNKQLILHACQQKGIQITQREVDEEISRLAKKFRMTSDQWIRMLNEERNISPKQYARDIVFPTIALRRLSADSIRVPEEEVNKMLDAELGPRVQVRIISLDNKAEADRVHAMAAAKPESFKKLAEKYSKDSTSASVGGLIAPIRRHVGDPIVEEIAFGLQEGQVSKVFHVANQFFILKCDKYFPANKIGSSQLAAARERIVDHLQEKRTRDVASTLFRKLQEDARVQNVLNNPELSKQMPGVAATINNAPITMRQLSEECIVRHGEEVLDGEINRLLLVQAMRSNKLSIEQPELDAEIERAALAYGFETPDGKPIVKKWLDHVVEQDGATVELYVRDAVWPSVALKKLVGDNVPVTQEDLQRGYDANYGPRAEVLAIVMTNQRQATDVWRMARDNPTAEYFGNLATQYSVEPVSRANLGRVPPIQRNGGRPAIEKAAFELNPGEVSGLTGVDDKWIILYCLGRTEPVVKDFGAVRDELYKDIHEKKLRLEMARLFDTLKETSQIDNFLTGTSQSRKRPKVADRPNNKLDSRVPFAPRGNATTRSRTGTSTNR